MTPYRMHTEETDQQRIENLERDTRQKTLILFFLSILVVVQFIMTLVNAGDVGRLSRRNNELAACRMTSNTAAERHELTREQDTELCTRACEAVPDENFVGLISADCTWEAGGRRTCACSCAVSDIETLNGPLGSDGVGRTVRISSVSESR